MCYKLYDTETYRSGRNGADSKSVYQFTLVQGFESLRLRFFYVWRLQIMHYYSLNSYLNTDVKYINFPFPQGFPALTETEKSVMAVVSSVVTEVQVNLPPPAMKLSLIKLKMLKKGYLTKLRTANLLPIFSLLPTLTVKFPT